MMRAPVPCAAVLRGPFPRATLLIMLLMLVMLVLPFTPARAGWGDAVIARVDETPVLESDVTIHELLFGSGTPYDALTQSARLVAVDRLISQRLLLAEAARFALAEPAPAAVEAAVERLSETLPAARKAQLDALGMADGELTRQVHDALWADAFVEARIRAFVVIRDDQVKAALAQAGGPRHGESELAAMTRLRQQMINAETANRLTRYLLRLAAHASIRRFIPGGPLGS